MNDRLLEGARVLVVEDEYLIADDLSRALQSAGARTVGPAATIEQAENLIAGQPIDAAILDLNLRGHMAVEFIEQLSASKLPCLIVSGYGRDSLPESLDDIPSLEKPVAYDRVVNSLAVALGREAANG